MMKTKITRISKRSLSMILAILMMFSIMMVGTFSAVGYTSLASKTIYFDNTNTNYGTVYLYLGHGSYAKSYTMTNTGSHNIWKITFDSNTAWTDRTKLYFASRSDSPNGQNYSIDTQHGWPSNNQKTNLITANDADGGSCFFPAGNSNSNLTRHPIRVVAGDLASNGWDNKADLMTYSSSQHTYTYSNVAAGDYTFAVVGFDDWNTSYRWAAKGTLTGAGASWADAGDGDKNIKLSLPYTAPSVKVTLTSSNKVNVDVTPPTYTIAYNKGSYGSGTVSSTTKTYGTDATLSSSTFTRTGYTQDGWSTTDGGAKTYNLGGTYTTNADTTLYPHWAANTYTVTLNKNSGSGGTNSVTATYGSAMPSATMPTRDGYNFAGYYDTSATSGGTQYYTAAGASARTWNKASDTTLYARWTLKTYTITYKSGDNATGSDYTATKTHGSDLTLRGSTYSRTGYNQTGWSVNSDGSTKDYNLSGSYTANAAATLYPYWELKSYSITLSESGTTGGVLKVDGSVASTATHGSHTFRVDAPAGYEISSISSTGATWTNHETYATSTSVSITGAYTISVTYVKSANPALKVDYTGAGGTTYTTTNGDSVTTSTRHNVTVTFTNQSSFDNGTSYTVTQKIGSNAATTIASGTTSSSGGNIVAKAAGTLSAGTYLYTVTVGSKSTAITVVVNQSYSLAIPSVSGATLSASFTDEFGNAQLKTAADTYYAKSGTSYTVTYTADSDHTFSSSSNTSTTSSVSSTVSSNTSVTAPTIYEKKFTLTKNTYKTNADSTTSSSNATTTLTTVTGTDVASGQQAGYYVTSWQVTSGTVYVNGTAYTSSSGAQSIVASSTSYTLSSVTIKAAATVRFNFTERSYTLTKKKKVGDAAAANIGTQACYRVTKSTVTAPAITGYKVTGWQVTSGTVYVGSTAYNSSSGVQSITAADTYSLSNVTIRAAATIQFNYVETTHTVTVQSAAQNSVALGNVSPASGSAGIDTALSISAEAKTGYEFVNWTGSNLTFANSNSASTSVTASADGTATANFRRTRVYLDVASYWTIGSNNVNHFAAYFFWNNDTNNEWVTMTQVDGVAGKYYADIPAAAVTAANYKLVFVALNNASNAWGNKVYQTGDLTPCASGETLKNLYTLTSTGGGSWSASPYFPPRTYSVIVNAAEHGTVGGVTSQTVQVPDEGTAYTLPTPQASYGYKFTGWEVVSGSINYNNTTYTSGVFSTNATTAITANQASTVRANFDYNDNMNLYIVGRFRVYNTYTGSPRTATYVGGSSGAWSTTATNIKFQWNETNHYYYVDTNSSIAELSASLSDKQYFRVYDQSNTKNWQLSADQALTESNEATHYTMTLSGDKSFYFNDTSNSNGPVKICFDPVTNELWFTIPARHTASVGTITTSPHAGTSPGYTGAGGTITVNNSSSATVSEGTNYAIKVTPTAGYKLTALAVNGNSIISGHENATSEFTINRAMGVGGSSYTETITATFTAISYSISVSDNSSGNGGEIKYKKNGGTATATAGTATVEDRIQPVVTVNRDLGYKLTTVQLKNGSNVTQAVLTNNGTEFSPSYSVYGMKAYDSKLEANFAAIQPAMASISTTTQGVSISGYTVNAYAGQTITITPHETSTSYGVISFEGGSMNMVSGVDNATKTQSGNTFTVTIPKNIGPNASSTAQYTFTITPKNSPAGVSAVTGAPQTITINVSYSGTPATNGAQQAYMNLKTMYDTYTEYGITDNDVVSGFTAFENARTAAGNTLGNFPTNLPAWNASAANYTSALSNLTTKYGELVFKTNTIYVLSQYSSDVKLHTYNRSGFFDTEATQVTGATQGDGKGFAMTLEGTTNSGKYLYSMTYQGKCDFTVYKVSGSTTVGTSNRISNNITLATTTNSSNIAYNTTTGKYVYGNYYLDLKDKSTGSTTFTIENVTEFADFGNSCISATGATGDNDLVGQCEEGDTGYSVSTIISKLGISYSGASLVTSSQTVNTSFAITGPARGESSTVTVDSSHNWVPTKPGRYTVVVNASLGTDSRASAGATFTGTKSTVNNTETVLSLFVAYDDIEIFADMNGNVGTPTIHFTYTDNNGNDADLPYEFDMVTGSESIYSYTISVSTLYDVYGLDLLNGTVTVGGQTYHGIAIDHISIDSVNIDNSSFVIERDVARTGTLWLKADSTNMKTFNAIAYGSSTRAFKAVLRNGNTDTDFNNSFAEVNGTGIITDGLVGNSYQYSSFYAAKDTTANYDFSYTLRVKANTDITHKDGNTTNYYYFDHWERINGSTTTTTGLSEVNGADINILTVPNYDTDADVTYVAVYKLTSTQKRVQITYKFQDYDTDDENYVYDPDKPLKDASYTKTVKLSDIRVNNATVDSITTVNAAKAAASVQPIIKSNYFDYTLDENQAVSSVTETNDGTNMYKFEVTMTHTPHKYKIIYGSNQYTGYYQQTHTFTGSSNSKWYIKDASNNQVVIGTGAEYKARFGIYQNAATGTEGGVSYNYDTYTIFATTGTPSAYSSIAPAHQEVYYDQDTPKVRHNFYIIDAMGSTTGDFVGAGVLYATTDSSGNYRQSKAATHLASDTSRKAYINGILNTEDKKRTEYKAQTIDNVGFRYLPYSGNESIIRYSNELKGYMYTFAGENTNSSSLSGQKLRVFSFFVYQNGSTYTNVVSTSYAQVERYIPQQ